MTDAVLTNSVQVPLRNRFNELAPGFYRDMALLQSGLLEKSLGFLKNIPFLDSEKLSSFIMNCYGCAAGGDNYFFLQPGQLADWDYLGADDDVRFEDYVLQILKDLGADDARPLNNSFMECRDHEIPLALFFKRMADGTSDFEFYGLKTIRDKSSKNQYVWVGKPASKPAEIVEDKVLGADHLKGVDIFANAEKSGHDYFAGFLGLATGPAV